MLQPGVNGYTLHYVKSEEKDREIEKRQKERKTDREAKWQKDKKTERLKDRKA